MTPEDRTVPKTFLTTALAVLLAVAVAVFRIRSGAGVGTDAWRSDPIGPDDLAG